MSFSEHPLSKEARSLSRDEFLKRHSSLFLLVRGSEASSMEEELDSQATPESLSSNWPAPSSIRPGALVMHGESIAFHTDTGDPHASAPSGRGSYLLPLIKRRVNPYPDRISIGRARNCDVTVRHKSVSKLHAHVVKVDDGAYELIDVGSRNGTRVNGELIPALERAPLAIGDEVCIGGVFARVISPETAYKWLLENSDQSEE